jgi:hypothetical protein
MRRVAVPFLAVVAILATSNCGVDTAHRDRPTRTEDRSPGPTATLAPASGAGQGLLLAMVVLDSDQRGRPVPLPARLGILSELHGQWRYQMIDDPDSNVFHKAMVWAPAGGSAGILTAGGQRAILKLWRRGRVPEILWEADFGGRFNRMRDVEAADLYGDGNPVLVVATHDQGVVAVVRPRLDDASEVIELDRQPDTIVHEVEVGDLDGDGVLEVYATPSLPNRLDGTPQPGRVVRYVPATGSPRTLVADLGQRHAKEILVEDIDGDGRDELYVVVEAVTGGRVEIRRYDRDSDVAGGATIAVLPDTMCRFLTAGDLEGDGTTELVAAAKSSGLWLLRPPGKAAARWSLESVDQHSSGFEHAAVLVDLDGDGRDELYVANDRGAEVNQYRWRGGGLQKRTIHSYPANFAGFTWNIMPVPVELIP